MTSFSRNARIAGLLYLTPLTAPLRLIYIPIKLFVAACERGILGTVAVSLRPAGVQVAVPSAHPRCLADAQLLRLSGYERQRHIVAAI